MPIRNGVRVGWEHRIDVERFLTMEESPEAVRESMDNIYRVLKSHPCFNDFEMLDLFREEDDLEEANDLLNEMYDYADANLIWIE